MSDVSKIIYFDVDRGFRVDSDGAKSNNPVTIQYQDYVTWRIYLGRMIDSVFTLLDLSSAIAWSGGINDIPGVVANPMVRIFDENVDKTHLADGYVDVVLDADTAPYLSKIGTKKAIFPDFEIRGRNTEGRKKYTCQFQVIAINSIDPATGDPLDPASLYFDKSATLGLLRAAPEYQFSVDGETSWHDEQVDADRYYQTRYPEGEWGEAIAMVVGIDGVDGVDAYTYVAYASSAAGADWNLTPSDSLRYRAEIHSATELTPVESDFAGATWVKYLGIDGTSASNVLIQYSADNASFHDEYSAGTDIYIRFSVDGGSNWTTGRQFTSANANTPLDFDNGDLVAGVLTVTGTRPVIEIRDNNGKKIEPDEVTYSTNTSIDLTSYGTISGTWQVIFGQGEDGEDGTDGNVLSLWQGAWVDSTTYDLNDTVYHEGSCYISIKDDPANLNKEPGVETDYWDLLAQGSASPISGGVGSTDNAIPRANGTDGDTLQSSGVTIDDNNNITTPGYVQAATHKSKTITGTTYTLTTSDPGGTVWSQNTTGCEITIPTNASAGIAVDSQIPICQEGAGTVTITAASGVTLNGTDGGSCTINNQYSMALLTKRGTDAWRVAGDVGAVS